jgi:hypothetical protein
MTTIQALEHCAVDTSPAMSAAGPLRVGNKLPTLRKMKRVQSFLEIALSDFWKLTYQPAGLLVCQFPAIA